MNLSTCEVKDEPRYTLSLANDGQFATWLSRGIKELGRWPPRIGKSRLKPVEAMGKLKRLS